MTPTETSADKRYYDRVEATDTQAWDNWHLSPHVAPYLRITHALVTRHFAGRTGCTAVELGAGSCSMSLSVSDISALERIVCMDISSERMRQLAPRIAAQSPAARADKLSYVEGSFNERLDIADASVDLLMFDASMHHASSIWNLLAECRRILRPDGLLVAQREQYLGTFTSRLALRRLLVTEEVQQGVVENAYLRQQYEYFLRARHFNPSFIPVAESPAQRLLGFLNGLVFSKWVIAARPE